MLPNHLVDARICQPILKENWKNVILWNQDLVNIQATIRSNVFDFQ
jgi:ubiquitin-protein ligase